MGVTTKGKTPTTSFDTAKGNVTSSFQPPQQQGPVLGPGDAGFVSPDAYAAMQVEFEPCVDGHPVSVHDGAVVDLRIDFSLPGLIFLSFASTYSSRRSSQHSSFGVGGWMHSFDEWLEQTPDGFALHRNGFALPFAAPTSGQPSLNRNARLELRQISGTDYAVFDLDERLLRSYSFERNAAKAHLVRIQDVSGNSIHLAYRNSTLVEIRDTANRELRFIHDDEERIVAVEVWARGQLQQSVTYAYHESGELASATNALGHSDRYAYDGQHRLVSVQLKNGTRFHYQYDPESGECVHTWGDGGIYTFTFERQETNEGRSVVTTDAIQPKKRLFNSAGSLLSEETFDGKLKIQQEFDADQLITATGLPGEQYQFTYDERGNMLTQVDPAGNVTSWEYLDDLPVRRTLNGAYEYRYERDAFGRMVGLRMPQGVAFSVEYDRYGRLSTLSGPEGRLLGLQYDEEHNVRQEANASGGSWSYEYDALGRLVKQTDPMGNTSSARFDAIGQLVELRLPDGTSVEREYDPQGKLTSLKNELGHITRFEYGGTGVLTQRTSPEGHTWKFQYDLIERLVRVENPLTERHEFNYDSAGNVAEEATFDGRRVQYGWDDQCRLVRIDNPDKTWRSFKYGKLSEVLEEDSSHGLRKYEYDSLGRLVGTSIDEGGFQWSTADHLDEFGRATTELQGPHRIDNQYDQFGRLVLRAIAGVGETTYQYNPRGSLNNVQHRTPQGHSQGLALERDRLDRIARSRSQTGAIEVLSSFDSRGHLTLRKLTTADATAELEASWNYDPLGRVNQRHDALGGTQTFGYNADNQVIRRQTQSASFVLDYRPDASLIESASTLATGRVPWTVATGNILRRTDDTEFEYDACHRCTAQVNRHDGTRVEYVWDCRDQLREVRLRDGRTVRFFYDAVGRRVQKVVHPGPAAEMPTGETTQYVWSVDCLAAEFSPRGARGHVHNPGTLDPLLQIENGEVFVVVLDNNGAPQELVDERGRVAWWARFSEWGKTLDEHSADGIRSPFRLSGHYGDEETGLSYARFRYWDADHGRWHSPDPLSIQGGLNPFAFDGSPLLDTDPFGLDTALGDQGEALAKNHLRNAAALQSGPNDQGGPFTILGSMQNGSGHGVDIVARDRNGQLVVIEVKVNTSRLSDDQKDGPDAYARDRAARVQNDVASDSGAYKSADKNTQKLAQEIANAPGKIRGLVVRVEVDANGNAKVKKVKEWCN